MSRDTATVLDIALACRRILSFCAGIDRAELDTNHVLQFATLHQIIVIGEAVGRLSDAFRDEHSTVPWHAIRGMRNHVTHRYDQVDLDDLWSVVQKDIPELLAYLEPLIGDAD